MEIAPSRLLDYVEEAERRAQTSRSELILVSVQVVEFLCRQWRLHQPSAQQEDET